MVKPANVVFRRVTARFIAGFNDGPDADSEPDIIPARGEVAFRPGLSYAVSPEGEPDPFFLVKSTLTGVLDSEGYLCTAKADGTAGVRGILLFVTDNASLTTTGWTWTATPKLKDSAGRDLPDVVAAFSFSLPASPEDLDLAKVAKVPASGGASVEQAFALVATAASAAESAEAIAEDLQRRIDSGEFSAPAGPAPVVQQIQVVQQFSDTPALPVGSIVLSLSGN